MIRLKCLVWLSSALVCGAGDLASTYRELQQFVIPADAVGWSEGPMAKIVPLMTPYKEHLRSLTAKVLETESDPVRVKAAIEKALRLVGVGLIPAGDPGQTRPYGQIRRIEVIRPVEQPALLAVKFDLQLGHAIDSSLTVYRRDGGWKAVFRADHNDYAKWELDAYQINTPTFSKIDQAGNFLMMVIASSGVYGSGSYRLRSLCFAEIESLNFKQLRVPSTTRSCIRCPWTLRGCA